MLSGVHESVFVLYVVAPHLSFLIRAVLFIACVNLGKC